MIFGGNNEQRLVNQLQNGNREAAREFYARYAGRLTAVCARYVTNGEDQRDVMQEAMISIFSHIADFTYRGKGSLQAWAARIVANEALRFLRSRHDYADLPPDDLMGTDDGTGQLSAAGMSADGDEPPVDDLPPDVLHQMISRLPTGYRTVLNLYVFEQHSHQEISRLLGISESTSASQLHRAKRLLAKMIRQYLSAHPT